MPKNIVSKELLGLGGSMKKTVSAVKYGLETLGVTPDKLFSLIESSKGFELDLLNGYTQEDYGR